MMQLTSSVNSKNSGFIVEARQEDMAFVAYIVLGAQLMG